MITVIVYFYFILRNTSKEVSMEFPYAELLNKNLTPLQSSILIENSTMHFTKEFPKELSDIETTDTSRVPHIIIPEGSIFKFCKAIQVKNVVSGNIHSFLLGEVHLTENNEKNMLYYTAGGGLNKNLFQETDDYLEFKKAPWQSEKMKNLDLK